MVETQSNLWNFKNEIVRRTRFADDTVLIAESKEDLKEMMNELHQKCVENSMSLNAKKTKVMVIDKKEQIKCEFKVENKGLAQLKGHKCLGSWMVNNGNVSKKSEEEQEKQKIIYIWIFQKQHQPQFENKAT